MKRTLVLVTGVASIVGARLAARLVAEGHDVVGLDDLSSGSWALVRELDRDPRFSFEERDVALPFRVDADVVYHLAVPSSRRRCEDAPVETVVGGVVGTGRVLELGAARGARVVMATSLERWGEGVRCAETLAVEYVRGRRTDVRLVRSARAFGPNVPLDDDGVVTRLSIQAARGERLDAGPYPQRPLRLSYVDDVVESLVRAMRHELRLPPFVAPLFETSPAAALDAVLSACGAAPSTRPGAGTVSAVTSRAGRTTAGPVSLPVSARPTVPETLPAQLVLGLEPTATFETAVARTAAGIRARLEALAVVAPLTAEGRATAPITRRAS